MQKNNYVQLFQMDWKFIVKIVMIARKIRNQPNKIMLHY